MSKDVAKSTAYKICRYVDPSPLPASQAAEPKARARRRTVSTKPATYQDLLDVQERLVRQQAIKPQTAANRASTLRAFLKFNNLDVGDPVGHELRASFPARCEAFAKHLAEQGKTARNISNALSTLRPWRELVVALDTERAIAGENLPPFNQAVRSLLKDFPVKRLARQTGVPPCMIYGWLKGKKPRLSNAPHIYRIETFFGVPHGELAVLAGISGAARIPRTAGDPVNVGYRESLAARTSQHYFFKPAPDSPLRTQWYDFLRYKTAWEPALNRGDNAAWRTAPFEFCRQTPTAWAWHLDGVEVPSAKFAWSKTAAYLGWLNLPKAEGGAGLPASQLHTLAWFAVRGYIDGYLRWVVKRCGNRFNGYVFEFFSFAMSLLRVGTGYLQQQPEFLATLPPEYADNDWEQMCRETFALLKGLCARQRKYQRQTRDPKEPIRHILEMENPLEAVADMIQRMRADRPLGGSPWREAVWARDLALIKLLVSNPLRLRNLATLTWRPDNRGQLYQRPDGSWWIRIERHNFKNFRGAAGDHDYDMPVQEMAWGDLERYLKVFRPRLLAAETDYVFVGARQRPNGRGPTKPWTELSVRIAELTRKYLWRCPGIGAHAFRHLVATAIIKTSKLSDFKTAALVLNDRLATVEKNYAHLRSADGANRMHELLGSTFSRM
jgi:integrase